jgi:mannose-1-phosphate guanylyltransferase/mannose-6-phosphate isomerase
MSILVELSETAALKLCSDSSPTARSATMRLCPVVLAGGSGTRLWPISRKHYPKQLVDGLGPRSLLQTTVQRLDGLSNHAAVDVAPIIVCGAEHRLMTTRQLDEIGIGARLVAEPSGRDTAPALSLAAMLALSDGHDSVLVVMPADHLIPDRDGFQRSVLSAARFAESGAIVTLAVRPRRADAGFGYIKLGLAVGDDAREIERFIEEPPLEVADQHVASGDYWCNSGILVVRASVWLGTLQRLQPPMHAACVAAFERGRADGACYLPDPHAFAAVPSNSIEHAVVKHLAREALVKGVAVPLATAWSDLGSWDAIWDALDKDDDGNVAKGRVIFEGATSCYARSEGRLIACLGVTNLAVIETADAVLVVDRSRAQHVKSVVGRITEQQGSEADSHRNVQRPWGCYDSIDKGARFQVKRVIVRAGARLSLQLHHHRAEHWTVVRGTALVTRGDESFLLSENESTFIPLGVQHRLENPGKVPLEIIEVQSGSYLGEDDVVRFEDNYDRVG